MTQSLAWVARTISIAVLAVLLGKPAYAQDNTSGGAKIEEIIVSAERREARMQDVPIAISALTAETVRAAGVVNTQAFNGMVPSLIVTQSGPADLYFIRGVGSPIAAPNGEASVAIYIDGVYLYSPVGNVFPIGADIQRVEVLKGPQGTLFGRNATAGVIQIITKDPSHTPGGQATVGYGNFNTLTADFYGTAGITDNLAADFTFYEKHMGNGYGVNFFDGSATYKNDNTLVRTKWLWTPTEDTEVRAVFSYTRIKGSNYDIQIEPGHVQLDGKLSTATPYNTNNNWPSTWHGETYFGSLQIDQNLGFAKLENIFSYRTIPTSFYQTDNEASPASIINADVGEPSKTITEELRLLSSADSKIHWVTGVYYIHADTHITPLDLSGAAIAPAPLILRESDSQSLWAIAPYAQATVEVFRNTNITGGIRYNHEHLSTTGTTVELPPGNVLVPGLPESGQYHNVSWRAAIDHKWTPDIMTYFSASRSFKSGGYNLASAPGTILPPFLPEELTAYEIGAKTELFERRVRFNASGYYYNYRNVQVQVDLPAGILTSNGPSATYKGFDADMSAAITERFTVSGGINYVEGHYGPYPGAIGYPSNPFLGSFVFDGTGKTTVYTPKWSGNIAANYVLPTSVGEFTFNANLNSRSLVYVAVANREVNPGYAVQNDSIVWTPPNGRFSLRVWVLNAFNKKYINFRQESGIGDFQEYAPPRTFGGSVSVKFGAMGGG